MMHRKSYELGLARKDLLLTHEKGKSPEDGSGHGVVSLEGGEGLNQTGGSTAEPGLDQNQPNSSQTGWNTGSRTGSGTGSETGSRTGSATVPEPVSPSIPARVGTVSVDPLTP